MNPREVIALLQAHEEERLEIKMAVFTQQQRAAIIRSKIYAALDNTHFKSEDERYFAYRDAERFINELYKPFNPD